MSAVSGRRALFGGIVVVLLALAAALGYVLGQHGALTKSIDAGMPSIKAAPEYVLKNQLGQSVSSQTFNGKVQIVTFLFPYCTNYCPLIAANLVRFEHDLKGSSFADRVRVVAFNVDPAGSGPSQLRAFMQEYGWNPQDTRWQFLTGSPEEIRRVVYRGYMVYYQKESFAEEAREAARERARGEYVPEPSVQNEVAARAHVNYDIVHNDVMEIVGPDGRIRKIFDDAERVPEEELFAVVRTLTR